MKRKRKLPSLPLLPIWSSSPISSLKSWSSSLSFRFVSFRFVSFPSFVCLLNISVSSFLSASWTDLCLLRIMDKDHLDSSSPRSNYSSPLAHHHSMSSKSFSPNVHSNSSFSSTDDPYETSSPVNESDEIVLREYYDDPVDRCGETSLWHDLERDGIHTPAIPSFILNSPPMGPIGEREYFDEELCKDTEPVEVTIHSLRKGIRLSVSWF